MTMNDYKIYYLNTGFSMVCYHLCHWLFAQQFSEKFDIRPRNIGFSITLLTDISGYRLKTEFFGLTYFQNRKPVSLFFSVRFSDRSWRTHRTSSFLL